MLSVSEMMIHQFYEGMTIKIFGEIILTNKHPTYLVHIVLIAAMIAPVKYPTCSFYMIIRLYSYAVPIMVYRHHQLGSDVA